MILHLPLDNSPTMCNHNTKIKKNHPSHNRKPNKKKHSTKKQQGRREKAHYDSQSQNALTMVPAKQMPSKKKIRNKYTRICY